MNAASAQRSAVALHSREVASFGAGSLNTAGAVELAPSISQAAAADGPWLVSGMSESAAIDGQSIVWGHGLNLRGSSIVWGNLSSNRALSFAHGALTTTG